MDLPILLLGAMLAGLALTAAGLLIAMVLLEREPDPGLEPAPALAGRGRAPGKCGARRVRGSKRTPPPRLKAAAH